MAGQLSDSFQGKSHLLVCAIDFGTTYSGYALSFSSNKDDVNMYKDWGSVVGIPCQFKTPTVVLIKKGTHEFVAFGNDALHKYSALGDSDGSSNEDSDEDSRVDSQDDVEKVHNYLLFSNFKMNLHNDKKLGKTTYITSLHGDIASALTIFSHGLKHLSEHALDLVVSRCGVEIQREQIRWVITVPAIWSDAAKQFMREVALKAGIIDTLNSDALLIALEPEAASIHCRQITQTQNIMVPGTKYLVLDCGGGTLDVTAHQLQQDDTVYELYKATGGDYGATRVDGNFITMLESIIGEEIIGKFKENFARDWLDLLSSFEQKKKVVGREDHNHFDIKLSRELFSLFKKETKTDIKKGISAEWKNKGVVCKSGFLQFPANVIADVFEPVVRSIVEHIKGLLAKKELKGITHLLLVGGFGESPYLQKALKKNFSHMKIIIPDEASNCVMKGAVRFGHNPTVIASRRSRKTYGTDVYPLFDPSKHDPAKTNFYDGKRRAEGLFRSWLKQGEEVTLGTVRTFPHVSVTAEQTNMSIGIFASDLTDPQYCSDSDVEQLGNITVQLPGSGLDRKVEVSIKFGGTEITVEGRNKTGGESAKASINFMHG